MLVVKLEEELQRVILRDFTDVTLELSPGCFVHAGSKPQRHGVTPGTVRDNNAVKHVRVREFAVDECLHDREERSERVPVGFGDVRELQPHRAMPRAEEER